MDSVTGLDLNPQQREARTKIENAATQFMLVGSASLPGRPSNLTREQINSMTPKPGVMGEAQAKTKARETAAYLEREIQAVQSLLNSDNLSNGDRSQLAQFLKSAQPLAQFYRSLEQSLGAQGGSTEKRGERRTKSGVKWSVEE